MPGSDVVVIGGSAGGITALRGIFETFHDIRDRFVFVVLHRAPQYGGLAEVLQGFTTIPIHEPSTSPWKCTSGEVTLAPAGYHLLAGNERRRAREPHTPIEQYDTGPGVRAHLTLDGPVLCSRPSLDVLFASAAQLVNSVTAVLLSCASEDGADGCQIVKAAGGRVVLQDPASCEAAIAVNAALRKVEPDHVADPQGIGRWLSAEPDAHRR
ncbi:two-component system chemotaxis response regulator CheB [Mycobacterium sp. BK086]|uniref:chemotaxis protein CheB n=1 Tax=Mycobacterium sp. BK086 TaxID=2512165 RepID=UPI001061CFDE|nr:chemotaxis protein CheB [Mycobacterium sp. BK086]TDO14907.1 two-component system chemotaxis response regulator CheB [Mycobacterium sp. BK086]